MLRADLGEVFRPRTRYSRRPIIWGNGINVVARRNSDAVVGIYCRRLIAAGFDPAEPMEVYRGETLALHVRSIGEAAELTVEEGQRGSPRFRKVSAFAGGEAFQGNSSDPPMSDTGED